MWLLKECQRYWKRLGKNWEIPDWLGREQLPAPDELLDVDDPELLLQSEMPLRIKT